MAHVTPLPREPRHETPSSSRSAGWPIREARERSESVRRALTAQGMDTHPAAGVVYSIRTETGWTGEEYVWRTTVRLDGPLAGHRARVRDIAAETARRMTQGGKRVRGAYVDSVRTADNTYPYAIFLYSHDPRSLPRNTGSTIGLVDFR